MKQRSIQLPQANGIDIEGMPIIDPRSEAMKKKEMQYAEIFFKKEARKGFNAYEAKKVMSDRNILVV